MKGHWKVGPKPENIKNIFGKNAKVYDLANDVISFGLARCWRKKLVSMSEIQSFSSKENRFKIFNFKKKKDPKNKSLSSLKNSTPSFYPSVLDCASGTGDLAFEFKRSFPHITVQACDFCHPMLERAKEKAKRLSLNVKFHLEDITSLTFPSSSFDFVSIAYGIRNVIDPEKALKEMARVTRPGGYILILETGDTRGMLLGSAIRFYFKFLVPLLGGWVSGDRKSYKYLADSSRKFPCGENFSSFLRSLNLFKEVHFKKLFGGASFIYKAKLLEK